MMAVIACGYGYMIVCIFIKNALAHIFMLLRLVGLSAFLSFVAFMDNSMWGGSPDLVLTIISGGFAATVIYYFIYFLVYSVWRLGNRE